MQLLFVVVSLYIKVVAVKNSGCGEGFYKNVTETNLGFQFGSVSSEARECRALFMEAFPAGGAGGWAPAPLSLVFRIRQKEKSRDAPCGDISVLNA
jgi:hypothetical protein